MRSFFRLLEVQIHSREWPKKPVQVEKGVTSTSPVRRPSLDPKPKKLVLGKNRKSATTDDYDAWPRHNKQYLCCKAIRKKGIFVYVPTKLG